MHRIESLALISCVAFVTLFLLLTPSTASARPTVVEYARCSGILVLAAAVTKADTPSKYKQYMEDANTLQRKASKLSGYSKSMYAEVSFNSSQNYMDALSNKSASPTDFWSDAGYCRGLAQ